MQDYPCQFNIQPIDGNCSQTQEGEYRYETYSVQVPDKNDGVVNVHSVVWSKGDNLESTHNFYMNDTDEDGGYNHFELRNHDRAYTLKRNDGSIIFSKGEENPAMERAAEWLEGLQGQ
jgi:hypothetical protein